MTVSAPSAPGAGAQKPRRGKKTLWVVLAAVVAVLLAAGIAVLVWLRGTGAGAAGTVNGVPVCYEELRQYAEAQRATVAYAFSQQHGIASMGDDFWDTDYDGATPRAALYDAALAALVRDKVIQKEAANRGIIAPLDYNELLKAAQADAQGLSPAEYLNRQMGFVEDELKTHMLQNDYAPTEADLAAAFGTLPAELMEAHFTAQGYQVTWESEAAEADAERMAALLAEPGGEAALLEEFPDAAVEPFSFYTAEIHREDVATIELAEQLRGQQPGFYVLNERYGSHVMAYLTQLEDDAPPAVEDVPRYAETEWINTQYDALVEQLVRQAEVDMKSDAIKKII